ncbi:MAG: D-amino acid aminotransferase [Janthinobacterium lividum]
MHDPLVYLNGALTPLSEAKIPVLDRGFIFGDGVYEVIPIYQGRPFRAEQHMARLARSLAAIGITNLYTPQQWMEIIGTVVAAQSDADQLVYMQVTRGVAPRAHAFPKTPVTPTVFIMSNPLVLPSAALRSSGARCVTMEDQRCLHCEIKSVSLLGNILAAQHAVEHEATEAIQFRDGFLTEASSSNVWVVKDGAVYGPPKDNLILEGIRYGLLQELCAALGIPFASRRLTRAELMAADEVLLSSATKELLAVSTIDGQAIGEGKPGAVYEKLYQAYRVATGR